MGLESRSNSRLDARLRRHASVLFPARPDIVEGLVRELCALVDSYRDRLAAHHRPALDETTSYLITYGDSFIRSGEAPLRTLADVLHRSVEGTVSDVHLLPMFPWTSDDGFGVVDHRRINPGLGTWHDVEALGRDHVLMFDFVANHVSASCPWFRGWLAGNPRYADYFIAPGTDFDTSRVVRPRTTPLTHPFPRPDGTTVSAWTTFGPDQVDVNAANPAVLVDLTDVLLGYLARGATTVRLDAIGYLWKESGTTCIHQPGTHAVIKMWRAIVDDAAPGARILTETNVPHAENVTYLGDGSDEAHMVYQFALPPLVLHSFVSGSSQRLSTWAGALERPDGDATWFNFLASHDGIGMRPAEPLLSVAEREELVERTLAVGGAVSHATAPDGSHSVYELNVSYLDALAGPDLADDPERVARRALAAHALLLSLVGVPAIYYHSLFGSSHDIAGMRESGSSRRINREQLNADTVLDELTDSPRRRLILEGMKELLGARSLQRQFSPRSPQVVLDLGTEVFAVRRGEPGRSVLAVVNVSGRPVHLASVRGRDIIDGDLVDGVTLPIDGYVWLEEE